MTAKQPALISNQKQDRFLRSGEVINLSGLSRTTLWRLERVEKFPARRSLSAGTVGWLKSEVDAWIEARQIISADNCKPVAISSCRGRKPKTTITQE